MRYLFLCYAMIVMAACSAKAAGDQWQFATPAWAGVAEIYPGGLRTRKAGETLLIRRPAKAIYRFDPGRGRLTAASESEWTAAGVISDCQEQPDMVGYRLDTQAGTLQGKAGVLAIPGFVVDTQQLRGGQYGAVLVANGPARSLLPFFGGGGGLGPYRHFLVALADEAVLGPGAALHLDGPAVRMCWSADERFVVYTDLDYIKMTVIAVSPLRKLP